MSVWIRLDTSVWDHPDLEISGWPTVPIWIFVLCAVKIHGKRGGRLSRSYWSPRWIARHTDCDVDDARRALDVIEAAGLVELGDHEITVPNWSSYQIDTTAAERQRRSRAGKTGNEVDVTGGNGCHDDGTGHTYSTGRDKTERGARARDDMISSSSPVVQAIIDGWPSLPEEQAEQTALAMRQAIPVGGSVDLLAAVREARLQWASTDPYDAGRIHRFLVRQVRMVDRPINRSTKIERLAAQNEAAIAAFEEEGQS